MTGTVPGWVGTDSSVVAMVAWNPVAIHQPCECESSLPKVVSSSGSLTGMVAIYYWQRSKAKKLK